MEDIFILTAIGIGVWLGYYIDNYIKNIKK